MKVISRIEPLCRTDPSYRVGLAACYNYIGEGRQAMGDLDGALDYYLQAIRCCEGERTVSGMGVFYSNAGYALYKQEKLDQAQEYIDKANLCFAERGAMWGRSKAKSYAALLAIKGGKWDEAEALYQTARDIAQKGGNPSSQSLVSEVRSLLDAHRAQSGSEQ